MGNNKNLNKAKVVGNDEFYTCYEDIEKKINNYDLTNKIVYCNCDDWHFSNFFKFFSNSFKKLGIKKVVSTGFNASGRGFYASYDGVRLVTKRLKGNGSFDSKECLEILNECDIVITNPPFSIFKEYVDILMSNGKSFIIIGTEEGATYKNVFPYIRDNKIWIGSDLVKRFISPDGKINNFGNICWFTNVESKEEKRALCGTALYSNEYKIYDNYRAIEVSKIKDIPTDYVGVMGVPVTYIKYHNPNEYIIIGESSSSIENAGECHISGTSTRPIIDGKKKFTRIFIKKVV